MPSLTDVLANIPGYGAYVAKRQLNEEQGFNDIKQATSLLALRNAVRDSQQEEQLRATLAGNAGNVEDAMNAAIRAGNLNAAARLSPLVKLQQEQRMREETPRLLAQLNSQYSGQQPSQTRAIAPDFPTESANDAMVTYSAPGVQRSADPRQDRINYLQSLSVIPQYANNPIAIQRIQSEIDRLQNAKPMVEHNFSIGDNMVQPHISYDDGRTWQPIPGSKPSNKFAKQVMGITDPSKEPLSEEAIKDLAVQSLYDSNVLAGYRRDTAAMARIGNARVKLMREGGITSEDVVSGRAGFKADNASLSKIIPQYDAITAFENTAIRNGRILVDLAKKVDETGIPAIERWIRAGKRETGDEDVAAFAAQLHLYKAEAARILTQPNLSGILTDTARKDMDAFMKDGASQKQIERVVGLLERDFQNRKETLESQILNIRQRMSHRVAPGQAFPTPGGGQPGIPTPGTGAPAAAGGAWTPEKEQRYQELLRRRGNATQ